MVGMLVVRIGADSYVGQVIIVNVNDDDDGDGI